MSRSRVTSKFQVTIPKEVREEAGLKPGEVVLIERVSDEEIRVRRFPGVKDPLKVLIGVEKAPRHIPVEELEERIEEA